MFLYTVCSVSGFYFVIIHALFKNKPKLGLSSSGKSRLTSPNVSNTNLHSKTEIEEKYSNDWGDQLFICLLKLKQNVWEELYKPAHNSFQGKRSTLNGHLALISKMKWIAQVNKIGVQGDNSYVTFWSFTIKNERLGKAIWRVANRVLFVETRISVMNIFNIFFITQSVPSSVLGCLCIFKLHLWLFFHLSYTVILFFIQCVYFKRLREYVLSNWWGNYSIFTWNCTRIKALLFSMFELIHN